MDDGVVVVAAIADACGVKQKAAATPANVSVGAAALVAPCGIRMRAGLLWAPKGLLSAERALTGSGSGELVRFGAPDIEGA